MERRGKLLQCPPSPKPIISDPQQMCRDEFWGHLALLWFWLCPRPSLRAAGESDGHGPGWDPAPACDEESWDFPPATASHPCVASSLELDAFQTRAVCSSFKPAQREHRWCLVLCHAAWTNPFPRDQGRVSLGYGTREVARGVT